MTNESSSDSSRHEHGVSPRRAARAAREQAESGRNQPVAPYPSADSAASATSAASPHEAPAAGPAEPPVPAAPTEAEIAAELARVQAVAAAQRARTGSAQRARSEAIEAQRAAAERVRETLRANAAGPRRARSASGRSAISPDSAYTFAPSAVSPAASATTSAGHPAERAPEPTPPVQPPAPVPPVPPVPPAAPEPADEQRWDAREHATMSFNDILAPRVGAFQGLQAEAPQTPDQPRIDEFAQKPLPEAEAETTEDDPRDSWSPAIAVGAVGDDQTRGSLGHEAAYEYAPEATSEAWAEDDQPAPVAYGEAYFDAAADDAADYHYAGDEYPEEPLEHEYADHEAPAQGAARESLFLGGPSAAALAQRKKRRRRRNTVMAAVLLGFGAVIFGVVLVLQGVMDKLNPQDFPAPGGASVSFEVKAGWGPQQIGRELVAEDIVASDKLFLEAFQLVETESRVIHPGTYELREQMPALDAASILIGEGGEKVGYVAIKQNTRLSAVLEETAKATGLSLSSLEALAGDPAAFGITGDVKNLEGFLHPGEYRFPLDSDAQSVLQLMVDATNKALTDAGITDPAEQYHVLKVASILQAEARPDDYATVAGALENRLGSNNTETNGLLQVDSTVIYGLDRYTLQISKSEKVDAGNPYNSYVHKGLPPTPIGSPGTKAIEAAAHPESNDYFYWVTVDTNSGETKFATTYRDHLVNQNEFRAWCAANQDVCK